MELDVAIEFVAMRDELVKALKYMRPARPQGRKAQSEFVDLNARGSEIELVSTSVSTVFPAEVTSCGYARTPYLVFEWFGARIADLPEELSDSGLSAKVLAAQEQTAVLIDRAIQALAPLDIKRTALSEFVWQQIKKRAQG